MFCPMLIRSSWVVVACLASACAGTKAKGPSPSAPEALPERAEASQEPHASQSAPSESTNREGATEDQALPARCTLPFEPGPCKAAFSVYWFDPERRACEPRIYGGCAGNENRFEDLESCEAACLKGAP